MQQETMCEEDKTESLTKTSLPCPQLLTQKIQDNKCPALKYSSNIKALYRPHICCNKRLGEYKMLLCQDDLSVILV